MSLEPDGGNLYVPHKFMIDSGRFWRCAHGKTGFGKGGCWTGCWRCALRRPIKRIMWKIRSLA